MTQPGELPDFDKLWDFSDPGATEERFRAILPATEHPGHLEYRLELLTQIARTFSLRKKFTEAHAVLDAVKAELSPETRLARVRYLLERGRAFHAAERAADALPLFEQAFEIAWDLGRDLHAIDAAHMLAIAAAPEERAGWCAKAMEIADQSSDPRARRWTGVLCHNQGLAHLDAAEYEKALDYFRKDLDFRRLHGPPEAERIARWCVGHALRRLGRLDEALALQRELEAGEPDGFVFEELAEIWLEKGENERARTYFARALPLLEQVAWVAQSDPTRLARIKRLAAGGA